MNKAIWGMLNETEKALLREAEPKALAALDEDGLLELHDRIRRARNKYSKLYRRRARGQVSEDATRAGAHAKHARTAAKAEAFEEVLARVSREVARAARASATELRAERLAAARAVKGSKRPTTAEGARRRSGGSKVGTGRSTSGRQATPASRRARASSRASKARAQAKRDTR